MATWDDVAAIASGLAEVEEGTSYGNRAWKVGGKLFAWERPLRPREREALGAAAPDDPILGVRVPDEGAKQALIETEPAIYFTTPHFDGHATVLIRLDQIPRRDLEEAIAEAWHCRR
ncbi:MAG: MmcQ/YjbR family DNA-binding protein [Actinobacteria bacterium]|nr:MmcQ/YjbR family DNA-binding protein [Actinomycetota bacterium]